MKLSFDRGENTVLVGDGEVRLPTVTRVEVIDHTGLAPYEQSPGAERAYLRDRKHSCDLEVEISLQDDGRTLKVFVTRRAQVLSAT